MLLTPDEIIDLTGYRQPRKQVEALRKMGVKHFVRLDNRPVVDDSALSTDEKTVLEQIQIEPIAEIEGRKLSADKNWPEGGLGAGVYFLFLGKEIVYVGQACNVSWRIEQHKPTKRFDSFSVVKDPLNSEAGRLAVESHYIKLIQPKYNQLGRSGAG